MTSIIPGQLPRFSRFLSTHSEAIKPTEKDERVFDCLAPDYFGPRPFFIACSDDEYLANKYSARKTLIKKAAEKREIYEADLREKARAAARALERNRSVIPTEPIDTTPSLPALFSFDESLSFSLQSVFHNEEEKVAQSLQRAKDYTYSSSHASSASLINSAINLQAFPTLEASERNQIAQQEQKKEARQMKMKEKEKERKTEKEKEKEKENEKISSDNPFFDLSSAEVDEYWITLIAQTHASMNPDFCISPTELAQDLSELLLSAKSSLELQNDLLEILGFESIELISVVLSKRNDYKSFTQKKGKKKQKKTFLYSSSTLTPQLNTQTKKPKPKPKQEEIPEWLLKAKQNNYERDHSYDVPGPLFSNSMGLNPFSDSISLPPHSVRDQNYRYDSIRVPPSYPSPYDENSLIPVSEMGEIGEIVFRGYTHLNRIQSIVFPIAYKTNENLLISAPTGAGKTNIALMCVLHEINKNIIGGVLHREDFKIVYVAPMKALAQEITRNFSSRLSAIGLSCRELTGDTQLSQKEIAETHLIVTTPEKWDVITRKTNDSVLAQSVRLLLLDEVHLLHEDRGPVLEGIVARTLRQVEASQSMIRIIGLSATLPNFADVAAFLKVGPHGLFHFDASFRPVPLETEFIGVKQKNPLQAQKLINEVCFERVIESLKLGHQVMVFVHSRKETAVTAEYLINTAAKSQMLNLFSSPEGNCVIPQKFSKMFHRDPLFSLVRRGISIHHAGMLKDHRRFSEQTFYDGYTRVMVCTSTLAWGVNLPTHTVIIKGTQIYNAERGKHVNIEMLDVMQIFGRAGRPQFDKSGLGIIITQYETLNHFLALVSHQMPIESQFTSRLADNLNAEIVLGTVSNVKEAIMWLSYTYMFVRMMKNPALYGISADVKYADPLLQFLRERLILEAAKSLDERKMITFAESSGEFSPTAIGRVASHYYLRSESIELFNEKLQPYMNEEECINLVCMSPEFSQLSVRKEELPELEMLKTRCFYSSKIGEFTEPREKVFVLFQAMLLHLQVREFTLISDTNYISQNIGRVFRGLFEYSLKKSWSNLSYLFLNLSKQADHELTSEVHPLVQFSRYSRLTDNVFSLLTEKHLDLDRLYSYSEGELSSLTRIPLAGKEIKRCLSFVPFLDINVEAQPISRTVMRIILHIVPDFVWNSKHHGNAEPFLFIIENPEKDFIVHSESFLLTKKQYDEYETVPIKLTFLIPISHPLPPQYHLNCFSERWIGVETTIPLSVKSIIMPEKFTPTTPLLDLVPLPITALKNEEFERIFSFKYFNPLQTQLFFTVYQTDSNFFVGSPTGSGKTVSAELAVLKLLRDYPRRKAVYIAPLKALVTERLRDWKHKFETILKKKVVELTGDFTPNLRALIDSDIILTTPEKWDSISRSWKSRSYVQSVGLMIIDEIHLLGQERGAILEVITTRMRYIAENTAHNVRICGLSTALANALDVYDWLAVPKNAAFNFKPAVRPVPLEVHIEGYPGKHYCPRMALMNKPAFAAIKRYSRGRPVLVFVSSRRQTRLTALDLITLCTNDENENGVGSDWCRLSAEELAKAQSMIHEENARNVLPFGIGLHHAGLSESDRTCVETLFAQEKIRVLVSTSTLAWGVNLPAYLVIVKGTEYFDAKTCTYVDYPLTDVLQMMGRAGRPQFDSDGKAVILVHEPKKNFYRKFLYEPFPVESSLHKVLTDHINAEICSGMLSSKKELCEYLTWTFFYRRLKANPCYYGAGSNSQTEINQIVEDLVTLSLDELSRSTCIEINANGITPTKLGQVASFYYLSHKTVRMFSTRLKPNSSVMDLMTLLTSAVEYANFPVRHNEDLENIELNKRVKFPLDSSFPMDDSHTKVLLLLQSHLSRLPLPTADFVTDKKSMLDQAIRILQAMIDISATLGYLNTTLICMNISQMIMQACWEEEGSILSLLNGDNSFRKSTQKKIMRKLEVDCIPELFVWSPTQLNEKLRQEKIFENVIDAKKFTNSLKQLPRFTVSSHFSKSSFKPDEEVVVELSYKRENKSTSSFAFCPHFPKVKQESWWAVLGDSSTKDLLALKKLNSGERKSSRNEEGLCSSSLVFDAPDTPGVYSITLFIMSDSYIGIDQQYDISFRVEE